LSIFLDAWDKQANKSAGRIMKLIFGIPIILFGLFFGIPIILFGLFFGIPIILFGLFFLISNIVVAIV
jgi:hypothetical protein